MSINSLGTGPAQNIAGDFLAHYHGDEPQKRRQLQMLKADLNILDKRIEEHALKGHQDQEAMHERDEVVQYIKDAEKEMQEIQEKYGSQGGRRKKHRRTKRHSKSRRSKSRRSKSRAKKSRRSNH